jgi:hypothetical protein
MGEAKYKSAIWIRNCLKVPAKKIVPSTKFLPVFDGVVKENSGRY